MVRNMAPSTIMGSTLLLSSSAARASVRLSRVVSPRLRYAAAVNSRRSIWDFISGNKDQEQPTQKKAEDTNQTPVSQAEPRSKAASTSPDSSPAQATAAASTNNATASAATTATRATATVKRTQTKPPRSSTPNVAEETRQEIEKTSQLPDEQGSEINWPADLPKPWLRSYPSTVKLGTVISVGFMDKTVRVAYQHREWDRRVRKYYPKTITYLVHDPRNSLREGDVIEFSSGAPRSPRVRHVVERIVAPFGAPVEDRPAVPTRQEREEEVLQKRTEKLLRQAKRIAAASEGKIDLEQATRQVMDRREHIGRIRALVIERTAAAAESPNNSVA